MRAFDQLTDSYTQRAWNLARASTRNADDADDVMQQAFIVAWRKRQHIPPEPWPWFAAVVVNCARNHRKRVARMRLREHSFQPKPQGPARLLELERAELRETLLEALDSLPDGEREAVTLCHIAGLTQQQASVELGLSLNTVKSQVKRGLDRLRLRLEPKSEGLEAYLSVLAFPPPASGWEAALKRWRDVSVSSPPGFAGFSKLAWAGAVAAAVAVTWLVIAWQASGDGGELLVEPVAATAAVPPASHTGTPSAPLDVPSANAGQEQASVRNTSQAASETAQATNPFAFGMTGPPRDKIGRSEILPAGPNPVGTLQVRTDYYEEGPIFTQWMELVTGSTAILHGPFRKFYMNGVLWEASQFENGLLEGSWESYHENAALAGRGQFRAGKRQGLWTFFHANEMKYVEGEFKNGEKSGIWLGWHDNGERLYEEFYVRDKREGVSKRYDRQGRKIRETTWRDGVKDGPETLFDEEGNALPPIMYERGKQK